uniref:PHD-type domain-containing protein n=1 Tax=Gouania willdenowi TaxID=441366 RepID=A0A8C5EJ19_GOUWI
MPGEGASDASESRCPVRRSGRQPKRTDKLEEFLLTTKRGTRRSAPPNLESGDPPSQTPTDAETASEASFDGNADTKVESPERRTRSSTRKQTRAQAQRGMQTRRRRGSVKVKDEESSENDEDTDDAKKDDEQEGKDVKNSGATSSPSPCESENKAAEKPKPEDTDDKVETEEESESDEDSTDEPAANVVKRGPIRTYVNKLRVAKNAGKSPPTSTSTAAATPTNNKTTTTVKKETKPKAAQRAMASCKPSQEDDDDDEDIDSDSSTSSSSSEPDDGGYDPNALYCICRQKHNKRFMICCDRCEEWFHGDCVGITEARGRLMERNGEDYVCPNCTKTSAGGGMSSASATPSSTSSGTEEKAAEDHGIKGRIEKAINPTGKKKIKIFQPVDASLPKCIGPGCNNSAQPDSVYCGPDCILKHAAAAMKSMSDVQGSKQDTEEAQKSTHTPKVTPPTSKTADEEEEMHVDEDRRPQPDETDEDEHSVEQRPSPATASWSSDHNYIAVPPEKTPPISPPPPPPPPTTVLNKKCMYLFRGDKLIFGCLDLIM